MEPLERLFAEEYPEYGPFPFGAKRHIVVRNILLAKPMLKEYGVLFREVSETEIEEMMLSFRFENCVQREELAGSLAEYSQASPPNDSS